MKSSDQHAGDQQPAGDDADDELREEIGQLVDIAVHALDQLAGRVRLVEGHVKPQQVFGQRGAQGVGGAASPR